MNNIQVSALVVCAAVTLTACGIAYFSNERAEHLAWQNEHDQAYYESEMDALRYTYAPKCEAYVKKSWFDCPEGGKSGVVVQNSNGIVGVECAKDGTLTIRMANKSWAACFSDVVIHARKLTIIDGNGREYKGIDTGTDPVNVRVINGRAEISPRNTRY